MDDISNVCCPFWYLHERHPINFPTCPNYIARELEVMVQQLLATYEHPPLSFEQSQLAYGHIPLAYEELPSAHEQPQLAYQQPLPNRQPPGDHQTQLDPEHASTPEARWLRDRTIMRADPNWLLQRITQHRTLLHEHIEVALEIDALRQQIAWDELNDEERYRQADRIERLSQRWNAQFEKIANRARELQQHLPRLPGQDDTQASNVGYHATSNDRAIDAAPYVSHGPPLMVYNAAVLSPGSSGESNEPTINSTQDSSTSDDCLSPKVCPLFPWYDNNKYWTQGVEDQYDEYEDEFNKYAPSLRLAAQQRAEDWAAAYSEEYPEYGTDLYWKFEEQERFFRYVEPHRYPRRCDPPTESGSEDSSYSSDAANDGRSHHDEQQHENLQFDERDWVEISLEAFHKKVLKDTKRRFLELRNERIEHQPNWYSTRAAEPSLPALVYPRPVVISEPDIGQYWEIERQADWSCTRELEPTLAAPADGPPVVCLPGKENRRFQPAPGVSDLVI